uniref:Uncharacterized protein n=1 Tax=Molossus molossus TaxID=27622 RepID=A0A7J8BAT2_MOLMO|nr:hypothetical protein HJG59_010469 [Molossus molossus]
MTVLLVFLLAVGLLQVEANATGVERQDRPEITDSEWYYTHKDEPRVTPKAGVPVWSGSPALVLLLTLTSVSLGLRLSRATEPCGWASTCNDGGPSNVERDIVPPEPIEEEIESAAVLWSLGAFLTFACILVGGTLT